MGIENQNSIRPTLEQLRNGLRGSDEAVLETGSSLDQETLIDVLKNPESHSREDLLESMFNNYSGEAYGDYQWQKETGGWTTPSEPTLYGKFRDRYPEFAKLSLDAGFVTHLSEFMSMIGKGEIQSTDFEGARNELKEKLGYKILYRGTMLTDDELQFVKNNGIISPLSSYIGQSDQPKLEFEAKALSTDINSSVEAHFHGENHLTSYLSVSEHEDIAIAVGRHFGRREVGKKFYILKLRIPVIDIISYRESGVRMPYKLKEMMDRNPDQSLAVSIDGEERQYKWGDDVESYVFWRIDSEDILDITQPGVNESSWNSRKTTGII